MLAACSIVRLLAQMGETLYAAEMEVTSCTAVSAPPTVPVQRKLTLPPQLEINPVMRTLPVCSLVTVMSGAVTADVLSVIEPESGIEMPQLFRTIGLMKFVFCTVIALSTRFSVVWLSIVTSGRYA
ncbi:hypothetical protein SDC9_79474 [bioreactor metagenome]|uniref:Uncharacterized protein n=1 Tax=bioreactor metagenome TaxID=1076179 RepID=A0A644YX08_9ZZZZ